MERLGGRHSQGSSKPALVKRINLVGVPNNDHRTGKVNLALFDLVPNWNRDEQIASGGCGLGIHALVGYDINRGRSPRPRLFIRDGWGRKVRVL